jgi:hypothetical protein
MATFIECDWCSRPIDLDDDDYSPDEYNRAGIDATPDSYVILEARFDGVDRYDHPKKRSEIAHFHNPDCYHGALRLIRDHRRWAEERDAGPDAALMPKWDGDGLKVTDPAPRREPDPGEAWTRKVERANQPDGVGNLRISYQSFMALVRAELVKIEDVRTAYLDGKLGDVPDIGRKRIQEIQLALLQAGRSV